MTGDRQSMIDDRARRFAPKRGTEMRRILAIALAALALGGGYWAWKESGTDGIVAPRIAIPAAEEGRSAAPPPQRTLFTGMPAAPAAPNALERQIEALTESIAMLDTRITETEAERNAAPELTAEIVALQESNRTLAEEFRAILQGEAITRNHDAERRATLEAELAAIRAQVDRKPDLDAKAEADHRRELERLRMAHDLKAQERAALHRLEAEIAAKEHERRKELRAIEAREAATVRFETERREAEEQAVAEAQAALEEETARRRSGGIAMDDTLETDAVRANGAVNATLSSDTTAITGGLFNIASGVIPQGTLITGILETAIQSDLPGSLRAVASEDVWSADASRLLMPKGTLLIGRYESDLSTGQRRVLVAWNSARLPDGRTIQIEASGTDALGRAGLGGQVDCHFAEKFEAAFLISAVSALGTLGGSARIAHDAGQTAFHDGSATMSDALGSALDGYFSVPPTLHVDQGTPITVFVQRDLPL